MSNNIRERLDSIVDRQSRQLFRESRGDVYKALAALQLVLDASEAMERSHSPLVRTEGRSLRNTIATTLDVE